MITRRKQIMLLRDRRAQLIGRLEHLTAAVESQPDGNHAEAIAEFDRIEGELDDVTPKLESLVAERDKESQMAKPVADINQPTRQEWEQAFPGLAYPYGAAPAAEWVDRDGKPVRMLSPQQKLADFSGKQQLSVGKLIRGMVAGNWSGAEAERLAMASNWNTTGGFLIQEEFSARLIDLARNQSVVMAAGAQTVPMASDSLIMARQTGDPTLEFKAENAAFSDTSIAFDAITFVAHTFGNTVTLSRELMADAPNAVDAIEQSLAAALAVSLDGFALEGGGTGDSTAITGLARHSGVGETGSVGAIAWEDFLTAVYNVENANHTPTAYIVSPRLKDALARLTSGDGTNSAKLWLPAPPDVAALRRFVSKNCAEARAYVGDFREMAFSVRQQAMIEVSTQAGDAFAKHQVIIKITWRGDWNLLRPAAFHRLAGITY